jgi:hypothetical protein
LLAAKLVLVLKHSARCQLQWRWAAYQAPLLTFWNDEGTKKLYKWANEAATPEKCVQHLVPVVGTLFDAVLF